MGYTFREKDLGTTVRAGKTTANLPRDTSQWGELGELAFMMKAASLGITASKPFGDRRPYDFLVEHGRRLSRVQVKSVFTRQPKRRGYLIGASQRGYNRQRAPYTADQVDVIAAWVAPLDLWYVIPLESVGSRKNIRVYPKGRGRTFGGLFEQYREAWDLLRDTENPHPL